MTYLKALIYGDSGAGKTFLMGSATQHPDTSPVLVLDARGQPITFRLFPNPPLVLTVGSMKDFNAPYEWLLLGQPWDWILKWMEGAPRELRAIFARAVYDYFPNMGAPQAPGQILNQAQVESPESYQFKTIVIDGITWTQRVSLNEIIGKPHTLPGDIPMQSQIQHWGSALRQMTNLVDLYFQLDMHVLMTALTKHDHIEAMGQTLFYPFVWGQSSLELPSLAELVGRLMPIETLGASQVMALRRNMPDEMNQAYNALLTKGGRTFIGKWQGVAKNPEVVLNPSISKLMEVLESEAL